MRSGAIRKIEDYRPQRAIDGLNRLTNLTWYKYPKSLLPNGLVIHGKNFKHHEAANTDN